MSVPSVTTSTPAVLARGVCKRFTAAQGRAVVALDDVTLALPYGGVTALVGADGAGKTTLLRLIAGLLPMDAGRLHVLGVDVAADPQAVQARIGYLPQRFGLYEDLSVQENLSLYADLHGVPQIVRRERCARLLALTDLARFVARPAGKLSGGMKQKLGLACTLVRSPELLLLDEPSVGVDPLSRRDLWRIVAQLVTEDGLTVLLSTAYLDEAERCAQVCVLHEGHVLAEGAPAMLTARAQGLTATAAPPEGMPARWLQARLLGACGLVLDAVPRGGAVHFIRAPGADAQALAALLDGALCTPREAELEDAFMVLLRERGQGERAEGEGIVRFGTPHPDPIPPANPPANLAPAIVVRDLVRKFGDFTAVASTSFTVARGEIFGLLGPNGAGKTTTFRMLCGLLPASSGVLEVAGVNLRTARARARARIGYVAQKFSLYGNLTVQENLAFFGAVYGLRGQTLRGRCAAVLAQFDLSASALSGALPAGFKQRLAMAAALLHQPDILFLDEPTSGIDPLARRAFWHTLTALAASGVTIVVTTHFMEEAEYCDRIVIQDAGRLLALGAPGDIRAQTGSADMNAAFIAVVEAARAAQAGAA